MCPREGTCSYSCIFSYGAFLIHAAVSFLDLIMLNSTYIEFVLLLSVLNSFSHDISTLQ